MKLHFDPDLPHQQAAIEAVCDLFRGQEVCRSDFSVSGPVGDDGQGQGVLDGMLATGDGGIGNRLSIDDAAILRNLQAVQLRHGLPPSERLTPDFTVEMETGTGKTYVYLRTMFELQRRYGWTKFVIVVPSVAIREGVHKTLQITREHFGTLYPGAKGCTFFTYDAARLGQVRQFATSAQLQVMVVSVGAINKFGDAEAAAAEEADEAQRRERSRNVMYRASEKTGGERPIDLVRATRPIVIVDEPQSVDGGIDGRGRQALARMDPLCTLRYSATHVDTHNPVYRLDAVEACERGLVKQIEVASATVDQAHNRPHVRLLRIASRAGQITASVELDVLGSAGHVRRQTVSVQDGDELQRITGRELYAGMRIGTLRTAARQSKQEALMALHLPDGPVYLREGEQHAGIEPLVLARLMIRRTIREHLRKQRRLRPLGVKVLSLFFVEAVARYRLHDEHGDPQPGPYATIFEEEYERWSRHPDFSDLFDPASPDVRAAGEVHAGYFSVDRQRIGKRMVELARDTSGSSTADDETYGLIMRDKEKLLGFASPLQFIFSHSALKEGWDNPNVFQICQFSTRQTERWRRQTIGRGLRLCVDQTGARVGGAEVNTLTVIAHEGYREFAEALQKEFETDGLAFGMVPGHLFAATPVALPDGGVTALGLAASTALVEHLRARAMVDADGHVTDALRRALHGGTLPLPAELEPHRGSIEAALRKVCGRIEIGNTDEHCVVPVRRAVLDSPEFKALWERIKFKTTYRVAFDPERLIQTCIDAVRRAAPIGRARLQWRQAGLAIGASGIEAEERAGAELLALDESDVALPDLLSDLHDRTQLTRRSLVRILVESGRLDDFARNPQRYIETVAEAIKRCKQLALVDGIRYQRLGDEAYYAQELFEQQELSGYLRDMLCDTRRSVYQHVLCDSEVERAFADQLEKNDAIKVYAKLPKWFKVPTPLGHYNPDWAVLVSTPAGERLYFVAETKGSLVASDLREAERAKTDYGRAHFEALAESLAPSLPVGEKAVCYERFTDVAGLVERAQQGSMPA
ncbi:type III restriction-modification system endonuclease [Sphaerotilus mobilis]|uniref:Type III restriction enzyme n=1 Tax=Sphaerotilus mobilis TaxID=47994 RepID=A0A4Q7LG33_9BURK|nr:DEAD/DEAH box helicase family protein [Sphaerotilus mobilis]RZS53154.1 type III restriction enzyme [Sphaerotilus mobilis]